MNRISSALLALAALAVLVAPGWADPVAISNHSFETPDLTAGGDTWTNINLDWGDDDGASNDQFTEYIPGFASEGEQHVGVNNADTDDPPNDVVDPVMQDLAATYSPTTIYTLTVGVGNRNDDFTPDGNETLIQLADANTGNVLAESIVDASLIPDGTFEDRSLVYTTGQSGDPIGNNIRIILGVTGPGVGRGHFDNVRLDATVIPEPSSVVLMVLGGLGLFLAARRGRRG